MPKGTPQPPPTLNAEWFEMEADMMRMMANPKRLMILETLKGGKRTVTEISGALGMTLQNTSQHLRVMRSQRIVRAVRHGQAVQYELTSPVLGRCCALVRSLIVEQAIAQGDSATSSRIGGTQRRARSTIPRLRLASSSAEGTEGVSP